MIYLLKPTGTKYFLILSEQNIQKKVQRNLDIHGSSSSFNDFKGTHRSLMWAK